MTPTVFLDNGGPTLSAAPAASSDRARLGEAARQFEAIFLRQMLAAARSTDFGGDDVFGGAGEETFRELRDARFAEIAAGTGSLGLAASIEAQLARFLGPEG
jgi:flagellar protein FlgJ